MSNKLRISGIVKSQRSVQSLFAVGTDEAAATALQQARTVIGEVVGICEKHEVDPTELPLPSHKAFAYLLAIANGESHKDAEMAPHMARLTNKNSSHSVGNLAREAEPIARIMWKRRDEFLSDKDLLHSLGTHIGFHRDSVEHKMPRGMKIEDLSLANATYVKWLDFLLSRDHLKGSLKVLVRAARAFKEVCEPGHSLPEILLVPVSENYLEVESGLPQIWCVSMQLYAAPKRIWKALARHVLYANDVDSTSIVEEFLHSTACAQYRRMLIPR